MALELVIGFGMALIMNKAFRGRGLVRASVLVPWAIPTAVSAKLWEWNFQPDGVVNQISGLDVIWTGSHWPSFWAIVIADVWKTAPFIALLVLAGLQIIPDEVYEAARSTASARRASGASHCAGQDRRGRASVPHADFSGSSPFFPPHQRGQPYRTLSTIAYRGYPEPAPSYGSTLSTTPSPLIVAAFLVTDPQCGRCQDGGAGVK